MTAFCPSFSPAFTSAFSGRHFQAAVSPHGHRLSPFVKSSNRQAAANRRLRPTAVLKATDAPAIISPGPEQTNYRVCDWDYKSFRVQYAIAGVDDGPNCYEKPPIVLIHGFGANCEHWRRNMQPLADRGFRVYALDLLGFGMGDKPIPGSPDSDDNPVEYTFDYWTNELSNFIDTVVEAKGERQPVFLVANSIGCMVTMQYAVENATRVAASTFISPSLRQLNVRKRSWVQSVTAPILMQLMANRPIGTFFLDSLSKPNVLRSVLQGAYAVHEAVDDDLVRILREPAKTPGALDVFLSFISYDTGPIPEDFLPLLVQPALVIWGEEDKFEPFELGQNLRHYSTVEKFVPLKGTGHCAHDELPERVNELIADFSLKHCVNASAK